MTKVYTNTETLTREELENLVYSKDKQIEQLEKENKKLEDDNEVLKKMIDKLLDIICKLKGL